MFEEYRRALRQPATPVRTFRLRAVLFAAVEQTLTGEELADGAEFFSTCVAAPASRLAKTVVLVARLMICELCM